MSVVRKARATVGSLLVSATLVLAACSSSGSGGGGTVSQSDLEKKLNSDSTVTALKAKLPANLQSKFPKLVSCIAQGMKKDAKNSELQAYLSGKKSIKEISVNQSKIGTDIGTCAKSAVGAG